MIKVSIIAWLCLFSPTREEARKTVERNIRAAWTSAGTIEKLDLIIVDCDNRGRALKSQLKAIFPDGMAHLPKEFKSKDIYCDTRRCRRHLQYLGRAEEGGFKFALFRYVGDPDFVALDRAAFSPPEPTFLNCRPAGQIDFLDRPKTPSILPRQLRSLTAREP